MATRAPETHELRRRLACGHFGASEDCEECRDLGPSPDPWLVADGQDLHRLEDNRSYRQSKGRGA